MDVADVDELPVLEFARIADPHAVILVGDVALFPRRKLRLDRGGIGGRFEPQPIAAFLPAPACKRAGARLPVGRRNETRDHAAAERRILWPILDPAGDAIILLELAAGDRKSGAMGKSVSVR